MASTPVLTAGDQGVAFVWKPVFIAGDPLQTLTGAVCTLVMRLPNGARSTPYTMTVASDGKSATYVATGTETATPGNYAARFRATLDSTHSYTSPEPTPFSVIPL